MLDFRFYSCAACQHTLSHHPSSSPVQFSPVMVHASSSQVNSGQLSNTSPLHLKPTPCNSQLTHESVKPPMCTSPPMVMRARFGLAFCQSVKYFVIASCSLQNKNKSTHTTHAHHREIVFKTDNDNNNAKLSALNTRARTNTPTAKGKLTPSRHQQAPQRRDDKHQRPCLAKATRQRTSQSFGRDRRFQIAAGTDKTRAT